MRIDSNYFGKDDERRAPIQETRVSLNEFWDQLHYRIGFIRKRKLRAKLQDELECLLTIPEFDQFAISDTNEIHSSKDDLLTCGRKSREYSSMGSLHHCAKGGYISLA